MSKESSRDQQLKKVANNTPSIYASSHLQPVGVVRPVIPAAAVLIEAMPLAMAAAKSAHN